MAALITSCQSKRASCHTYLFFSLNSFKSKLFPLLRVITVGNNRLIWMLGTQVVFSIETKETYNITILRGVYNCAHPSSSSMFPSLSCTGAVCNDPFSTAIYRTEPTSVKSERTLPVLEPQIELLPDISIFQIAIGFPSCHLGGRQIDILRARSDRSHPSALYRLNHTGCSGH